MQFRKTKIGSLFTKKKFATENIYALVFSILCTFIIPSVNETQAYLLIYRNNPFWRFTCLCRKVAEIKFLVFCENSLRKVRNVVAKIKSILKNKYHKFRVFIRTLITNAIFR